MQSYGRSRDEKVLDGLQTFTYLTTNQIADLYFTSVKDHSQRLKKTSERMKKMFDRGYVQRFRFPGEPYIFTIKGNRYSPTMRHALMVADCWIMLQQMRPTGGILNCEVEFTQEDIITDLLIEYKNNFKNEQKMYYVELENEGKEIIYKLKKYEALKWRMEIENKLFGQLCIVYNKRRTVSQLEAYQSELQYSLVSFENFLQEWHW